MESISYYAIFKNGAYLLLADLIEAKKLPHLEYLFKRTNKWGDIKESVYEFVNIDGNDSALQIGNYSLIILRYNHTWKYTLFNSETKIYTNYVVSKNTDFPWYNIFADEIFPKFAELTSNKELMPIYFNKSLNDVKNELEQIRKQLSKLEDIILEKSDIK